MKENKGWIGVDLDGTLAHYDQWRGIEHIGEPIPMMVELVKKYLERGIEVRIVTARVARELELTDASPKKEIDECDAARTAIVKWCERHIGQALPVTCSKDFMMITLYDDRCIQVEPNTGVGLVEYYKDAADAMNLMLEDIRKALGVTDQKQIMSELRRLIK